MVVISHRLGTAAPALIAHALHICHDGQLFQGPSGPRLCCRCEAPGWREIAGDGDWW